MYQYNEYPNNNDLLAKVIIGLGIGLVVAIIVGAKKLFEYLFY